MNIHEYQAKAILKKYNVPIPNGIIILSLDGIGSVLDNFNAEKYVVKAQIHAGGRGKAGGVKVTSNKNEAIESAHKMFGTTLITPQTGPTGQKVRRIYIEEASNIATEYYFSMVLDRSSSTITVIASIEGGVEIEEVAAKYPEKIIKIPIDPLVGISGYHLRRLAFGLGFKDKQAKQLMQIAKNCYEAFIDFDANQIEINPLIMTNDGDLLALDAKINFDDNALFRHPDIAAMRDQDEEDPLEVEANNAGLSYVKMEGEIGCMVNGAGLAMATMDIIKFYGANPANFLDVGGGADQEKVAKAFKIILSDKAVKGILVNIFGGIMRCDIIAEGIIAAAKEVNLNVPLVVRLAGTNFELGKKILENSGLKIIPANDLAEGASKIVAAIKQAKS